MAAAATVSRGGPVAGTAAMATGARAMGVPAGPAGGAAGIATTTARAARGQIAGAAMARPAHRQSRPTPHAPVVPIGRPLALAQFRKPTEAQDVRVRSATCQRPNPARCFQRRAPALKFGARQEVNGLLRRPCRAASRAPSARHRPSVRQPQCNQRLLCVARQRLNFARKGRNDRAAAIVRETSARINDQSGKKPVRWRAPDPLPPVRPSRLPTRPSRRPDRR